MFDVCDGWVWWFDVNGILVKLFWGFCGDYMLFIMGLLLFNILVGKDFFLFLNIYMLFMWWLFWGIFDERGLLFFNILVEKVFFLFLSIYMLFMWWLLFLDLLFDDIMLFIWWLIFKFLKIFFGLVDILFCIFYLFNLSLFFICFVNLWFRLSWFDFFCEFWVFLRSF